MTLLNVVQRSIPPEAWAEGENIPWNDPAFSQRMLREHLSQEHNLASRNFEIINRQTAWIHTEVLGSNATRILELACGPGFYMSRLAELGHECVGIDYSPASVRYATETASQEGLRCTFQLEDIRKADYGDGFGLVMMVFGQLNVFRRNEAREILTRACDGLRPGGLLLLEPQRYETVEKCGKAGTSWYSCGNGGGLFSDRPHLCLSECFWNPEQQTATQRFFIVDATDNSVVPHAMSVEAYTDEQYHVLLQQVGFEDIRFYPSLVGTEVDEESQAVNLVIVARKRSAD